MKNATPRGKSKNSIEQDEMLPEYDFSLSRPNKYASRYSESGVTVTLDPDVAAIFPGAREVNEALRALAERVQGSGNHGLL